MSGSDLRPADTEADGVRLFDVGKRPTLGRYVREIWRRRAFVVRVPIEELRAQHLNTALGNLWYLLNPVLLTATYYLVFGVVLNAHRGEENYITFLTIGIFSFYYTQRTVTSAARSITRNRGLLRSIYFPRAVLPMGSVISQTIALLPALVVVLTVAVLTGESPQLRWVLVLPILAGQALLNLGFSLIISRLAARYRDVVNLLTFAFRLLLYGSGVLYPVARWVSDDSGWRVLFDWNPLYDFITMQRYAVLGSEVSGTIVVSAAVWAMAALAAGTWYFLRGELEYGRE
jgi:teichoic acid transport system permease protein